MPLPLNDRFDLTVLHSLLAYVPETGQFFSRVTRGQKLAGSEAGVINDRGYAIITVNRRPILAHRLAIAFTTGAWPTGNVDHINGNPADNRISNLRDVHQSLNVASAHGRKFLQTGKLGIRFKANAWEASIKYMGKSTYLGRFKDRDAAQNSYLDAAKKLHGPGQFSSGPTSIIPSVTGTLFVTKKPKKPALTQDRLKFLVHYDQETGIFIRKISFRYRGREAGRPIGLKTQEGYLYAKIDCRRYGLHRLAYFYMTGNWPIGEIHHINHDPSDNRWSNLADITPLENNRLRRRSGPFPKQFMMDRYDG